MYFNRLGLTQNTSGSVQARRRAHRATRMHLAGLLVLVSILATGCAAGTSSTDGSPGRVEQPAYAAPDPNISGCEDAKLLASLSQYTADWNVAANPFVAEYLDPNVSAEDWLTGGATKLSAMEQAASGVRGGATKIHDRQLGSLLMSISDNYQVKLLASKALVKAVETGSTDAESAASEQISAAALAGRNLAFDLKDMAEASPQMAQACP